MTPGFLKHAGPLTATAALALACAAPTPSNPASRVIAPKPGEQHLRNIRQLTFGGNNAEAYFSADGKRLIFQRQEDTETGCDQQYVMNVDGSGMRRVSNGLGRTPRMPSYDRSQKSGTRTKYTPGRW